VRAKQGFTLGRVFSVYAVSDWFADDVRLCRRLNGLARGNETVWHCIAALLLVYRLHVASRIDHVTSS